jgi:hypothetical protein
MVLSYIEESLRVLLLKVLSNHLALKSVYNFEINALSSSVAGPCTRGIISGISTTQ